MITICKSKNKGHIFLIRFLAKNYPMMVPMRTPIEAFSTKSAIV